MKHKCTCISTLKSYFKNHISYLTYKLHVVNIEFNEAYFKGNRLDFNKKYSI